MFVKPAHMGSSVGIVKVSDAHLLDAALDQAFAHDPLAIVEAMASGVEVECAVLGMTEKEGSGSPALGRLRQPRGGGEDGAAALASEPGEIAFAGEWYDYAAKYRDGGMQLVVPARISTAASARVRELALEVFAYTGCEGLARVDFFVNGEQVLVNELEHDARLYADERVREAHRGLRDPLPRAGRPSLPARDRALGGQARLPVLAGPQWREQQIDEHARVAPDTCVRGGGGSLFEIDLGGVAQLAQPALGD